ncbi:MAG: MbcA/ParS/Xre antitoxin family protein [Pseudomonadales bacterium]
MSTSYKGIGCIFHIAEVDESVFIERDKTREWMDSKIKVLGNQVPAEVLATSTGRARVIEVLRKINEGDFS